MQTPTELLQQLSKLSGKLGPDQLVEVVINGEIAGIAGEVSKSEKREWTRTMRSAFRGPVEPLIDLNSGNDLVFVSNGVLYHYIHDDEVQVQPIRNIILRLFTSTGSGGGIVRCDLPD